MKEVSPIRIIPTPRAARLVELSSRLRKSQPGRIGSAGPPLHEGEGDHEQHTDDENARCWAPKPTAQRMPPSRSPRMISEEPTPSSTAPATSIRCCRRTTFS